MTRMLVLALLLMHFQPLGCVETTHPVTGRADPLAKARQQPLQAIMDSLGIQSRELSFQVVKSQRTFKVHAGDRLLASYPCVLGENPVGDKFHQGDRRTPEGTFTFRSKRIHPKWHKFIWVDYPNAESWRRYRERMEQGSIPKEKDIGGEIGIHGVPQGMDHWIEAGVDWTWGCIALKNGDLDEIYPHTTPSSTIIRIAP